MFSLVFLIVLGRLLLPLALSMVANQMLPKAQVLQALKASLPFELDYDRLLVEPTFSRGFVVGFEGVRLELPKPNARAQFKRLETAFSYRDLLNGRLYPRTVRLDTGLVEQLATRRTTVTPASNKSKKPLAAAPIATQSPPSQASPSSTAAGFLPKIEGRRIKLKSPMLLERDIALVSVDWMAISGLSLSAVDEAAVLAADVSGLHVTTTSGDKLWREMSAALEWEGNIQRLNPKRFWYQTRSFRFSASGVSPKALTVLAPHTGWKIAYPVKEIRVHAKRFDSVMLASVSLSNDSRQELLTPARRMAWPFRHVAIQAEVKPVIQPKPKGTLFVLDNVRGRLVAEKGSAALRGNVVFSKHDFRPGKAPSERQSKATLALQLWELPLETVMMLAPVPSEYGALKQLSAAVSGKITAHAELSDLRQASAVAHLTAHQLTLPERYRPKLLIKNGSFILDARYGNGRLQQFSMPEINVYLQKGRLHGALFRSVLANAWTFSLASPDVEMGSLFPAVTDSFPFLKRAANISATGRLKYAMTVMPSSHSLLQRRGILTSFYFRALSPVHIKGQNPSHPFELLLQHGWGQSQHQLLLLRQLRLNDAKQNVLFSLVLNTFTGVQALSLDSLRLDSRHLVKTLVGLEQSSVYIPVGTFSRLADVPELKTEGQLRLAYHAKTSTAPRPVFWLESHQLAASIRHGGFWLKLKPVQAMLSPAQTGFLNAQGFLNTAPVSVDILLSAGALRGHVDLKAVQLASLIQDVKPYYPSLKTLSEARGLLSSEFKLAGTLSKPIITGAILLQDIGACYEKNRICLANWKGALALLDSGLQITQLSGLVNKLPLEASGLLSVESAQTQLKLKGQHWPAPTVLSVLSETFPTVGEKLAQFAFEVQRGTVDFDLALAGHDFKPSAGTIRLLNAAGQYNAYHLPWLVSELTYDVVSGRLIARRVQLNGQSLAVEGFFKSPQQWEVSGKTSTISFASLWKTLENTKQPLLPTLFNEQGSVALHFKTSPQKSSGLLTLANVGFSTPLLDFPVTGLSGQIDLQQHGGSIQASSRSTAFRYAASPVQLTGQYDLGKRFNASVDTVVSPLLLNNTIHGINESLPAFWSLPLKATIQQDTQRLGLQLQTWIAPLKTIDVNGHALPTVVGSSAEPSDTPSPEMLSKLATLSSSLALKGNTLTIDSFRFLTPKQQSLELSGQLIDPFVPDLRQTILLVTTSPHFDLAEISDVVPLQLTQKLSGILDVTMNAHVNSPDGTHLQGELALKNGASKPLKIKELSVLLGFNDKQIQWQVERFLATGMDLGMTAETPDLTIHPLPISNAAITGKSFIIALYIEWFKNFQARLLQHPILNAAFPHHGNNLLSFEITDASIALKELILSNLIIENYTSTARLYQNATFEIKDITADSADGHLSGSVTFNPKDNNALGGHIAFDKMQANAVAKVLLGMSNQIFGKLSGSLDFTTQGRDLSEQLVFANAITRFQVEDGRLPAVSRIENMMVTANTLAGGLFNLNLNSVFNVLSPIRSQYFATLTGTFEVANGILVTNDFQTRGRNFNLDVTGTVRLYDAEANMLIKGTVSKEVKGVLGSLGSLSFSKIFGLFPPLKWLVSWIPGIGFVPGLGKVKDSRGLGFEIDVQGPIYDPASQKNFRWQE